MCKYWNTSIRHFDFCLLFALVLIPYKGSSVGVLSHQVFAGGPNNVLSVVSILGSSWGHTIWTRPKDKWLRNKDTFILPSRSISETLQFQNIAYFKQIMIFSEHGGIMNFSNYNESLKAQKQLIGHRYPFLGSMEDVIEDGEKVYGPVNIKTTKEQESGH